MVFGRNDLYIGRRKRRGLALPVAMSAAVIGLGAAAFVLMRPTLGGTVTDDYDGRPIPDAVVAFGNQRTKTDTKGRFSLTPQRRATTLTVTSTEDYACPVQEVPGESNQDLALACRPTHLSGTARLKGTDNPLPGLIVRAVNLDGAASSEDRTDDSGHFRLADVPANARLIVEGPNFSRREIEIGRTTVFDPDLRPDVISGTVRDQVGKPLAEVTVGFPGQATTTGPDGTYFLTGVPEGVPVATHLPGYRARRSEPAESASLDFTLEPLVVKGIYLAPDAITDDAKFNALLALADRTEINAMVIDVKDERGWLLHDSQNPLAREIGAVHPSYDIQARLQTLREHNIYAIARIVCMLDPTLATKRPELAVRNSKTGGIWKNANGIAWVNAMNPAVWRYNTEIALEAADLGFDEVQFDYVRFPSDGDLDAIDLLGPDTMTTRTEAIAHFLKEAHTALGQRGVALSADIFAIVLWDQHDNGIGQQLEKIVPFVDYLCPMVYPSHFARGNLGYDIPNDHPYDVVLETLQHGSTRAQNAKVKFRPWLQDFTYGPGIDYGPKEVRAQIQATYDFGATGWMLWNAQSVFTEAALKK